MRDLAVLFLHLLATVARLAGPGGARSVVAESVLIKHQLLILNRSRKRSPKLRVSDRMVAGLLCAPHAPEPSDPVRDRRETLNAVETPSSLDEAEISPVIFAHNTKETEPQGTRPGCHRRSRRHETAESDLGLS